MALKIKYLQTQWSLDTNKYDYYKSMTHTHGRWKEPREGVIIECPLNGQYHERRDVILTSQMAVSNNFIMVTIIQNIGNSSF